MRHGFVDVHGVSTHVTRCDRADSRLTVLVIPGNPGVATYYDAFLAGIHRTCTDVSVWCVSHAGHVHPPNRGNDGPTEDFSTVAGQIRHKKYFIEEYVPTDNALILVGHSIGCFLILHLLDQLPAGRVAKCMLLFPAVERLSLTPSGKLVYPFVTYFHWLVPLLAYPLRFVPAAMKEAIVRWYFGGRAVPACVTDGTMQLLHSSVVHNSLRLVRSEFATLGDADYDLIGKYVDLLTFYYGVDDHWCPRHYYDDMKAAFPDADIRLCRDAFQHAFVIEESEPLARIVCRWIVGGADRVGEVTTIH